MRPKDYSVQEVYSNTSIGLIFEFYSSKKTEFIAEDLSKASSKAIIVTGDSFSAPSWSSAILLKEYNGKRPRYQLKIAQQDYLSLSPAIDGILEWVNSHAALDYGTRLKIDLSFKNRNLQTLSTISNMDIGKMILKIDEKALYERFPQMKKSPFSLSVKKLVPFDGFVNISNSVDSLKNNFSLPIGEHYGIDFTDQTRGILRFNYIGGNDYAQKKKDINESIEYYIISTYQTLNSQGYTGDMQEELSRLTEEYSKIRRSYYEPEFFMESYKDITVSVDLKKGEQIIKSYWSQIRNPLLKLVSESGLKTGYFNWNSENGKFELKDAELFGSRISNINIVGCKIHGLVENCHIWGSEMINSRIKGSILVADNTVTSSLIESTRVDRDNKIEKSYIVNTGEIINCEVNESIIKDAGIGSSARLDEECTLIETRERSAPPMETGLKIEEVRDYKWIKSMGTPSKEGFANEFKIKY